ncbi:MAG: hypothetical protein R3C49_06000 [Planctomycetaceae bacterium]
MRAAAGLVLSPNSAIQAQWAAKVSAFAVDGQPLKQDLHCSTDPLHPGLLTSLTYQSVSLPVVTAAIWILPQRRSGWID